MLRPWLHELMRTRLSPMLHTCFPVLADGSNLRKLRTPCSDSKANNDDCVGLCEDQINGTSVDRIRIHDAFIVKYDAVCDMVVSCLLSQSVAFYFVGAGYVNESTSTF
jgi:hypothetical protein